MPPAAIGAAVWEQAGLSKESFSSSSHALESLQEARAEKRRLEATCLPRHSSHHSQSLQGSVLKGDCRPAPQTWGRAAFGTFPQVVAPQCLGLPPPSAPPRMEKQSSSGSEEEEEAPAPHSSEASQGSKRVQQEIPWISRLCSVQITGLASWYLLPLGAAALLVLGGQGSFGLPVSQTDHLSQMENGTSPLVNASKEGERSAGSSSHSLRHFYTAVWEPGQRLPYFTAVGYMDDQLFVHYDSGTREALPQVPWIKKVEKEDVHYWEWNTVTMRKSERRFSGDLETLQKHYNQSRGLYTWQHMYGCELGKNGQIRAYSQYSYSGRDFLSFDKETLTWTATDATAQIFKRKYDDNLEYSQYVKDYQEGICINQLKKFLEDGKKSLLKREPPTAKVTRKEGYDGLEIFTCRAHGFYPKEIDINWKKDGEVWLQDTFHGGVSPNSDGTYHTWLSIEIDPREKDHYQCHVEHDGLPEPLVLTYREPASASVPNVGLIVGITLGAVVVIVFLFMAGRFFYTKKYPAGYTQTAQGSDGGSGSSCNKLYEA